MKHIAQSIALILGMLFICYSLLYIIPGDPVQTLIGQRADPETIERLKVELGLDQPYWKQFLIYIKNVCQGDLGLSYTTQIPVFKSIMQRIPTTFTLAFLSIFISTILGLLFGILASIYNNRWISKFILMISTLGFAMPVFWSGLIFLFLASQIIGNWQLFITDSKVIHLLLAALTLGIRPASLMTRMVWTHMINALSQDFILSAQTRRISKFKIIFKYAFNTIKVPIITLITMDLGSFLTGAAITESIYALPGIGKLALDSILRRDHPVIMGTVLFTAIIFILINALIDYMYPHLDPRIKKSSSTSS